MARPYNALRRKMMSKSVRMLDIAREIHCTEQAVSKKFRNISPWKLDEIWLVMDLLSIDPTLMYKYFPKNGRNE